MAIWYGNVGYAIPKDLGDGIWDHEIREQSYYGEILEDRWGHRASDKVNDDLSISNILSIIADQYAIENSIYIVYAEIMGTKWKVNDLSISYPRLKLTLGGVYNG